MLDFHKSSLKNSTSTSVFTVEEKTLFVDLSQAVALQKNSKGVKEICWKWICGNPVPRIREFIEFCLY